MLEHHLRVIYDVGLCGEAVLVHTIIETSSFAIMAKELVCVEVKKLLVKR